MSEILTEREGQVLVVTLNRPERGNAFSLSLLAQLWATMAGFDADPELRVAVITGAGERSFSTGRDLTELRTNGERDEAEQERYRPAGAPENWMRLQMPDVRKPLIAAVNGHALGGGWALAQRCDLRLAAEEATFAITEIRYGLPVSIFATELVRLVPPAIAMELLLLGRPMTAGRAYEIGFLNAVVPRRGLRAEALAWAAEVAQAPPETAAADKELLLRSLLPDRPALRRMADEIVGEVRRRHVGRLDWKGG